MCWSAGALRVVLPFITLSRSSNPGLYQAPGLQDRAQGGF